MRMMIMAMAIVFSPLLLILIFVAVGMVNEKDPTALKPAEVAEMCERETTHMHYGIDICVAYWNRKIAEGR